MQPTTTPRANRIPRLAQPQGSQYRRLHAVVTAFKRWYLMWLLHSLGKQIDEVEAELLESAGTAHGAAQVYRFSRRLNARRRELRRQHATLAQRMFKVREELDGLEVQR